MLTTICSVAPFMVCLCWFITFLLHARHNDSAKRVLTVFLGTCTVLYLCHAIFFNSHHALPVWAESLWGLCSLSVYPLYFIYLTYLTCKPLSQRVALLVLLPGLLVALCMLIFHNAEADMARKVLNAIQVFCVMFFGYNRLVAFDKELANVYADTEGRDASAVKKLLIAFVATSLLSAVANAIGKQNVAESELMVIVVLLPFAILLYSLSYIGFTRTFSLEQFVQDIHEAPLPADSEPENQAEEPMLASKIERLMTSDYFLNKNLKITDVAREVGSCRTYVSNYINKTYGCSFSDYVNRLRIEHAKQLMRSGRELKMTVVSDLSGFSSEQSFYRNFKKFVGMTPAEWLGQKQ